MKKLATPMFNSYGGLSVFGATLALILLPHSLAATITNTTSCESGSTIIYGSSQCSTIGYAATAPAIASTSTNYSLSGNELSISFTQSLFASAPNDINNTTASANATSTVSLELETAGPVRGGYAAVFIPPFDASPIYGNGGMSLSIGGAGYSYTCGPEGPLDCFPLAYPNLAVAKANGYKPVTLGAGFSFSATQEVFDESSPLEGGSVSASTVTVLELFDSDGVTPVNIFEVTPVPEPASAGLIIVFVFISAAYLLVRKRKVMTISKLLSRRTRAGGF